MIDIVDSGNIIDNIDNTSDSKNNKPKKIIINKTSKSKGDNKDGKNNKIKIYIKTFGCSHKASDSEYKVHLKQHFLILL